ncbi:MAG TPA: CRISPR-associated helicase Cas3' [Thermodesulfobium narugense]|nr:CRISPR-associated helicase Cas3' [Thermodesulfobium narugense]
MIENAHDSTVSTSVGLKQIYSHPGILIQDHINRCLGIARSFLDNITVQDSKHLCVPIQRLPNLKQAIEVSITLHDFGKFTSFFQDYIRNREGKNTKLKNHAEISALYSYFCMSKIEHLKDYAFFSYLSIRHHHTDLNNIIDVINEVNPNPINEEKIKIIKKQIKSIDIEAYNEFIRSVKIDEDPETCNALKDKLFLSKEKVNEFIKWIEDKKCFLNLDGDRKQYVIKSQESNSQYHISQSYFLFQYIYSILLDADKTEAGAKSHVPQRTINIPSSLVDSYIKKIQENSNTPEHIAKLRQLAYEQVMANLNKHIGKKIFSITLPTGAGKTMIGLSTALRLREHIQRTKGFTPRIIYALPFISIIDQNADRFKEVLQQEKQIVDSSILLVHHHLSEPSYCQDDQDCSQRIDFDAERVLMEGWNSEIIVTTFIQLFQTMISYQKSTSRRFHKLANSIVIIDEIQSLPYHYWLLIGSAMQQLSDYFNTRFIIMTATQPIIPCEKVELADSEQIQNLLRSIYEQSHNNDTAQTNLDRYKVYIDIDYDKNDKSFKPKTIAEFINSLKLDDSKTYLFVANTIDSSKKIFQLLSKKYENKRIGYLSTSVTPHERKERIRHISECKSEDEKYHIVVSTQLVEAGVDIDFDVVYRDFAPLDSLIQSAGRCNRHGEKDYGEFHIVYLKDEESNKLLASQVYKSILLQATEKILGKFIETKQNQNESRQNSESTQNFLCTETEFLSLVDDYFVEAKNRSTQDTSREIIEDIAKMNYENIKNFELIKEQIYKSNVFVMIDDEAQKVWEEAKDIIRQLRQKKIDKYEANTCFEKLKVRFFDYVINVKVNKDENKPRFDEDLNMYVISKGDLDNYYDKDTGFGKNFQLIY